MIEIKEVLIIGMGLMGGSLSLAIKKRFPKTLITGVVRSEKSKNEIIDLDLAHKVFTEKEFFGNENWSSYELVVFSTPVQSVVNYIAKLPNLTKTIYTDLGSTKDTIIEAVDAKFLAPHNYVSSHPMCGSEFSGPSASKADLYEKKLCIVTRARLTKTDAYDFVRNFWDQIGSWTLEMESNEHDETLAYLSHLPHIISSLLVQTAIHDETVKKMVDLSDKPITGGGFRDMSRIAGSNFEMWISIFEENQKNIYLSLLQYKSGLEEIIECFNPEKKLDIDRIKAFWDTSLLAKEKIQKQK